MSASSNVNELTYRLMRLGVKDCRPGTSTSPADSMSIHHGGSASGSAVFKAEKPQVMVVSLKLRNRLICLARQYDNWNTGGSSNGMAGHVNHPARPIGYLRIRNPQTKGRVGQTTPGETYTLHTILSDGNIFRMDQATTGCWDREDPGVRVTRAIVGTILSQCNADHVVDRHLIANLDETGTGTGTKGERFVCRVLGNKHELLKILHVIKPGLSYRRSPDGTKAMRMYTVWSYTEDQILKLLNSALSIGQRFSVRPVGYESETQVLQEHDPSVQQARPSSIPATLMHLAYLAGQLQEQAETVNLYWE